MKLHHFVITIIIGLFAITSAHAQRIDPKAAAAQVEAWTKELDTRSAAIDQNRTIESALQRQQEALDALQVEVGKFRSTLDPRISELRTQLEKLGPAPAKDAEPEPEGIAEERARLNALVGELETASKIAGIQVTHASQLVGKIQTHRRHLFARQLLKRQQSPLSSGLWKRIALDAGIGRNQLQNLFDDEANWIGSRSRLIAVAAIAFVIYMLLSLLARRIIKSRREPEGGPSHQFFDQAGPIAMVALARTAPLTIATTFAYFALLGLDALTPQIGRLAFAIFIAIVVYSTVSSLSRTLLAPHHTKWRVVPVTDVAARRLSWLVPLGAIVHGMSRVTSELIDVLIAPISLSIAQTAIASIIFSALLASFLLTPLKATNEDERPASRLWPKWLKLPLWLATMAIFVATLLGYVALARFIAGQIINTGLVFVLAFILYTANREFAANLGNSDRPEGAWLERVFGLDEPRRRQIAYLVGFTLNLILLIIIAPLLLLQWGFSWTDIQGWLSAAFFGFNLGTVRLSVATVLIGVGLFVGGLAITRIVQRWLDNGPLHYARMDQGVAHSVRTGIGYAGFIVSGLLAVSYVGFDFTNVAIVAGALSVGIGFGLQSIINNFVSGLILLVERPIKVGDWVIIGDKEGLVQRISVRATEIRTFDRSSMIIPNSELITGTVVNWTHGDSIARVEINVGVSYDSDAELVHGLLLEVGNTHPLVLDIPKTRVLFKDFGASSLDFSLRVFIANVMDIVDVRTELRLEILKRFREENIEIPFPQRDLHIKSGLPEPVTEAD